MSGQGGGLYSGAGPLGTSITESELSLSDNTTANATSLRHGLLPKLSGNASDALKGDGTWGAVSGGGSGTALTGSALTVTNDGSNGKPFVATWTTSQVTSLGAVTAGTLKVATLPAKCVVTNVFAFRTGRETTLAVLTLSVGRAGASYIDYLTAHDCTTFGGDTTLGNNSAERGTNNTGYDLASWSGTTDVFLRFNGDAENLSDADGVGGTVIIEYYVIP